MADRKVAASEALALERVEPLIHEIRGEKVILDSDLARLYGVTTKRLNEQVKRNQERFPRDFAFQLTSEESEGLRSQFATSSAQDLEQGRDVMRSQFATASPGSVLIRSQIATASKRNIRFQPVAFTEHGAIMAANVLNSPRAVQKATSNSDPPKDGFAVANNR